MEGGKGNLHVFLAPGVCRELLVGIQVGSVVTQRREEVSRRHENMAFWQEAWVAYLGLQDMGNYLRFLSEKSGGVFSIPKGGKASERSGNIWQGGQWLRFVF